MRIRLGVVGLAACLWPLAAVGQVDVQVRVGLPSIRFEIAPPLVVVEEGVQVVPDYGEEVYFVDGWYWCRYSSGWYRTRDYRGGWVVVQPRYVPVRLGRIPPGKYKHHKGNGGRFVGAGPGWRGSEVKVKNKHGYTEYKVKEKGRGGDGGGGGHGRGRGRWK